VEFGYRLKKAIIPSKMSEIHIKEFTERYRLQSVIFKAATSVFGTQKYNWKENQFDFFSPTIKTYRGIFRIRPHYNQKQSFQSCPKLLPAPLVFVNYKKG
jgi:hypothetical protein